MDSNHNQEILKTSTLQLTQFLKYFKGFTKLSGQRIVSRLGTIDSNDRLVW